MLNGLTEVQSALYNKDALSNISKSLFNVYKVLEENKPLNEYEIKTDATAPVLEGENNYLSKIIQLFYTILDSIVNILQKLYYSLKEILPIIFDKFIESLLIYLKNTEKQFDTSFEQIFEIFQVFGLDEIYPETFDKIHAALQWKICHYDWINLGFLISYKKSLLKNTPIETLQAIDDLIELLKNLEKEIAGNKKFEEDVEMILDF